MAVRVAVLPVNVNGPLVPVMFEEKEILAYSGFRLVLPYACTDAKIMRCGKTNDLDYNYIFFSFLDSGRTCLIFCWMSFLFLSEMVWIKHFYYENI